LAAKRERFWEARKQRTRAWHRRRSVSSSTAFWREEEGVGGEEMSIDVRMWGFI
jgi:hypothetical protein